MLLLYIVTMVIGVTTATSSYSGYYIKVFDVLKLCMIIVVITTDLAMRIKRNVTLVKIVRIFLDYVSSCSYVIDYIVFTCSY